MADGDWGMSPASQPDYLAAQRAINDAWRRALDCIGAAQDHAVAERWRESLRRIAMERIRAQPFFR